MPRRRVIISVAAGYLVVLCGLGAWLALRSSGPGKSARTAPPVAYPTSRVAGVSRSKPAPAQSSRPSRPPPPHRTAEPSTIPPAFLPQTPVGSPISGTWILETADSRPCDAQRFCFTPAPARQRTTLVLNGNGGHLERQEVIQKHPEHVWGRNRSTWPPFYSFTLRAEIRQIQRQGNTLVLSPGPFSITGGENLEYFRGYVTSAFCSGSPSLITLHIAGDALLDDQSRQFRRN